MTAPSGSETYPAPSTLPPPARPRRELPLGVAILAVLVGLFGILILVGGLLLVVGSSIAGQFEFFGPGSSLGFAPLVAGVIAVIIGLIILGIGVALWRLRLWALVLGLIFLLFEMVSYGVEGRFVSLGFLLALVIFVYLLAVNRHFR